MTRTSSRHRRGVAPGVDVVVTSASWHCIAPIAPIAPTPERLWKYSQMVVEVANVVGWVEVRNPASKSLRDPERWVSYLNPAYIEYLHNLWNVGTMTLLGHSALQAKQVSASSKITGIDSVDGKRACNRL